MNANELADKLENEVNIFDHPCASDAADMLRQQQAEIEALKKQLYPTPKEFLGVTPDGVLMFKEEERNDAGFYMSDAEHYKLKCASQQAEIEALKPYKEKIEAMERSYQRHFEAALAADNIWKRATGKKP